MLKKICLLVNWNLYESKRHFAKKLAEALERYGIKTKIIDQKDNPDFLNTLTMISDYKPDLLCSFNAVLPLQNGQNVWDYLGIPFLGILVDPALYSVKMTNSPLSILACVDRGDVAALQSMPFENAFFWPHAVERELEYKKEQPRTYDVVFLGSCNDYESARLEWHALFPQQIQKLMDEAIDLILSDKLISVAEALVAVVGKYQQELDITEFLTIFKYLDTYTRGRDRVELIRAISDKNIHVHVFGQADPGRFIGQLDWSDYLEGQSNVTIHPAVSFTESLEILKQSKISLNSMPFFKDGTHERIFNSLMCGALPITSATRYLQENFKDGEEIGYYFPPNWSAVQNQILDYLNDEDKRKKIVEKGRQNVLKNHTWDKRVEQLLEVLPPMLKKMQRL